MSKTKNLFLALVISIGVLFLGCCASIFVCFFNDFDSTSGNILALVYLFLHLVVLAGAFYFAFRAYYTGKSSLIGIVTIDERGNLILKSRVVAIVISSLFLLVGIYATLLVFNLEIPLNFFSKTLKFAIMNVGYTISFIGAFFILYPVVLNKGAY